MDRLHIVMHHPNSPLLFHSGYFVLIFSLFLLLYSFVFGRRTARDAAIICFGLYFYYKSSGTFVLLLVACLSADYLFSLLLHRAKNPWRKKAWLAAGVMFSLSFLLYFKYRNFFVGNVNAFAGTHFRSLDLVLPVGISFYTFQSISYLVDIYHGKLAPGGYRAYLLYMTFFPHIVAGPIVRAKDFLPQIGRPTVFTAGMFDEAWVLIAGGLVKKAVIADYIGRYADSVFAASDAFSGTEHTLSVLCYTLQIFCDFSGYTDMAIGIALLLGFRLRPNFNSPYKALDITDFWRRWHISLSGWLRDYVYIPMGGNRKGLPLQLLFLLLTMLIGGFWHGASWKFIVWGGGHGVLLILHKLYMRMFPRENRNGLFRAVSWTLTFTSVALLWVPFRAESLGEALLIYRKIFTCQDFGCLGALLHANPLLFGLLTGGFAATLMPSPIKERWKDKGLRLDFAFKAALFAVLVQLVLQIRSADIQPFVYFRF